ncbi:hypothetical protein LMG28688_00679 [Paraburkholderia caffeinitolerans]|uniref:Signal peptide transmembrane protein n=1 Tax=Paraburkholderia caffeinitolerans TaxID=1723730 RepID=A0A6J5FEW4_9BURK|nr:MULTISPECIES: hypothetical protein [Paraburkholderia]CAB3779017.1 hypothetical protein LMG28688_00679 [Paraburkholderia caffeinitolerans]
MNEPRKKNPTFGVGVMIVVVVVIVIGTVLFNALRGKHEYEESVGAQTTSAPASAAAPPAASTAQ